MKKWYSMIALTLTLLICGASMIYAEGTTVPSSNTGTGTTVPAANCSGSNCPTTLSIDIKNPLKVSTIQEAVKLIVNTLVRLAIPVIVFFFLYSGISFIFAQGRPEKIKDAKNMFVYTIIGTLLILGAWTITNAIVGTVNSLAGK
jgi:hypothetical protein